MSTPDASSASGDAYALDHIRHQAKHLLKQARARDPVVLSRLRELLPQLAAQDDHALAESIRLSDVQHAVARKFGHANWAALKTFYERLDPIHRHAARFLRALRDDDLAAARATLEAAPAVARYSIHTAAAVGDADAVAAFLDGDAALARAKPPGDDLEPLLYAVMSDLKDALGVPSERHLATVRVLLDAGADPNAAVQLNDGTGSVAALFFPCVRGKVALARLLLERGAAPTDGESLYHAAQHDHEECLALLAEFGADLHRGPDAHGNTPLHFLAAHTPDNIITPKAMRGMHWLLAHGADPNVRSYSGRADHRQSGETPLHRAAAVGHGADVLRDLIAHGADVTLRRDDGATAYRLAMRGGHRDAAQVLADAGSDTTLGPVDRLLGACMAVDAGAAQRILAEHPGLLASLGTSERDALGLALSSGQHDAARLMMALGWPLDQDGEWGGTPLHWAAWNGMVEIARELVAAGAPVNHRDSRYGSSPLAWCAHGSQYCGRANDTDYPAIAELLIDAGASRAASYNRWNEAPESMARPSVLAVLRARGFVA